MAKAIFSDDLPLSRGGEDDSRSDTSDTHSSDSGDRQSVFSQTLIEDNNEEVDQTKENQRTARHEWSKPSITAWLELYKRMPEETVNDMFSRYNLSGDGHEVSWLKLYDKFNAQTLHNMIERYPIQRTQRSVNINLSDNSNLIDLTNNDQVPPPNNSIPTTEASTRPKFMSIHRPTRKLTYNSNIEEIVTNGSNSVNFQCFRSNDQLLNTLNNLNQRLNSIPVRTTSHLIPSSQTITTTANRSHNTRSVMTTTTTPTVSQIQYTYSNQTPFVRYTTQIPNNSTPPSNIRPIRTAPKIPVLRKQTQNNPISQNPTSISQSNQSSGDQLINALENLTINVNQSHKPPYFKYDSDPKIWLRKFEKSALLNGWKDQHKVKNFAKYVSDDVLNWISETFNNLETIDWQTFRQCFLNEFQSKDRGITNRMKLNTLRQEKEESVRAYLRRGLDLIESVNENMNEQEKIEILTFGLRPDLRDKVLNLAVWPIAGGIRDFKQFVVNAENFNEINKVIDGSHPIPKPNPNPKLNTNSNQNYSFNKKFNPNRNQNNFRGNNFRPNYRQNQNYSQNISQFRPNPQQFSNRNPRNYSQNLNNNQNQGNRYHYSNDGQSPQNTFLNQNSYTNPNQNRFNLKSQPNPYQTQNYPQNRNNYQRNQYYPQRQNYQNNQQKNNQEQNFGNRFKCYGCGSIEHKIAECPVRNRERAVVNRFENTEPNEVRINRNTIQRRGQNQYYYNQYPYNQEYINYRQMPFNSEQTIYTQMSQTTPKRFFNESQEVKESEDESPPIKPKLKNTKCKGLRSSDQAHSQNIQTDSETQISRNPNHHPGH